MSFGDPLIVASLAKNPSENVPYTFHHVRLSGAKIAFRPDPSRPGETQPNGRFLEAKNFGMTGTIAVGSVSFNSPINSVLTLAYYIPIWVVV